MGEAVGNAVVIERKAAISSSLRIGAYTGLERDSPDDHFHCNEQGKGVSRDMIRMRSPR